MRSSARAAIGGARGCEARGGKGDRVATIAPNTHQHLEQFYAIPQRGAVIVPMNYRLSADDSSTWRGTAARRALRPLGTSGSHRRSARRACRACGISSRWRVASRMADLRVAPRRRRKRRGRRRRAFGIRSFGHQLHQRHHLAPEGRDDHAPQCLDEFRGHSHALADHAGRPLLVDATHVPCQRLDVHLDGDGGGGGTHVLRKSTPPRSIALVNREPVTHLCAAPTVLIGIANGARGGASRAASRRTRNRRRRASGGRDDERLEADLGWEVTHVYGLTETAPFITICEPLPDMGLSLADGRSSRRGKASSSSLRASCGWWTREREVPRDGNPRRDRRARQRGDDGLLQRP